MPCYDKKLEASRQDFYNDIFSTRDVDCVITTGELELMMREKGWDLSSAANEHNDTPLPDTSGFGLPTLISHPGTSSGSYLQSIIEHITSSSSEPLALSTRNIRSADYEEYTLRKVIPQGTGEGEIVFKGAKCYGFRNLQNLVRKVGKETGVQVGRGAAGTLGGIRSRIKRKTDGEVDSKGYDYVEVMACHSGCVNGGGQLKPPGESGSAVGAEGSENGNLPQPSDREWVKSVEKAYWDDSPRFSGSTDKVSLGALSTNILCDMCRPTQKCNDWSITMDDPAEERRRNLFRTQYRAVESEVIGLAVKW